MGLETCCEALANCARCLQKDRASYGHPEGHEGRESCARWEGHAARASCARWQESVGEEAERMVGDHRVRACQEEDHEGQGGRWERRDGA